MVELDSSNAWGKRTVSELEPLVAERHEKLKVRACVLRLTLETPWMGHALLCGRRVKARRVHNLRGYFESGLPFHYTSWLHTPTSSPPPLAHSQAEMLGKLKDLGNTILGKFGMSIDNFKANKDPATGGYSISYQPGGGA